VRPPLRIRRRHHRRCTRHRSCTARKARRSALRQPRTPPRWSLPLSCSAQSPSSFSRIRWCCSEICTRTSGRRLRHGSLPAPAHRRPRRSMVKRSSRSSSCPLMSDDVNAKCGRRTPRNRCSRERRRRRRRRRRQVRTSLPPPPPPPPSRKRPRGRTGPSGELRAFRLLHRLVQRERRSAAA